MIDEMTNQDKKFVPKNRIEAPPAPPSTDEPPVSVILHSLYQGVPIKEWQMLFRQETCLFVAGEARALFGSFFQLLEAGVQRARPAHRVHRRAARVRRRRAPLQHPQQVRR